MTHYRWKTFARCCALTLLSLIVPLRCEAQRSTSSAADDVPKPAISAILKLFTTYEVVALPAAHGEKDEDDFILSLIRSPRFPDKVNDIVVECGNRRYQSILDRYIAGENVSFTEVQHVWRDTTQAMCGESGFYEELYPLVRSLNQRLPAGSRLRIIAADPPIDWTKVKSFEDTKPYLDRDGSIASAMEDEVLSRHRKALMLFGIFHLLHVSGSGQGDAVTRYERHFPGKTFVISGLGYYGLNNERLPISKAALEVGPLLLETNNTGLGGLSLGDFLPTLPTMDRECNVVDLAHHQTRGLLDAFLYLGPQNSLLKETVPADIVLDQAYRTEWLRRQQISGMPAPPTLAEANGEIVESAKNPVLTLPHSPPVSEQMASRWRQGCLDRARIQQAKPN
ncbi:MAG: hypothetical protein PW789_01685 [Edaphobacter sp.]|uniref:hypothetical protein n=1 Tax=Edaphobacter sp. TaxID=1934404 RepID=UPI0023978227|nr:hypothetical protein [Edaphobacter sp.]MDE1175302.1 hypothetical protein [Edaphobacter sp.]